MITGRISNTPTPPVSVPIAPTIATLSTGAVQQFHAIHRWQFQHRGSNGKLIVAANASARLLPPVSIIFPNREDKSPQVTVAVIANADPTKQVTAKVKVNPEIGTIVINPREPPSPPPSLPGTDPSQNLGRPAEISESTAPDYPKPPWMRQACALEAAQRDSCHFELEKLSGFRSDVLNLVVGGRSVC